MLAQLFDPPAPQLDLVMISLAVAILRTVKRRRCWVTDQNAEVQFGTNDKDGAAMVLAGETKHCQLFLAVPWTSVRIRGKHRPGQISPKIHLKRPNIATAVFRQQEHSILPRKLP